MTMISVEIVFSNEHSKCAINVWNQLFEQKIFSLKELQMVDGFTGKKITVSEVSNHLQKQRVNSFNLEFRSGSVSFSVLGGLDISRLDIINLSSSIADAESWVSIFLRGGSFLQARLYDAEYDRWQNIKDLLVYESAGVPHSHLPKISNGLPFPLGRDVVDVSSNSGRWVLKQGYIEAVGSTVWVSNELVRKLNMNLPQLEANGFFLASIDGCVKVVAWDRCFTSGVGAEAGIQNSLRKYIFGAAC